MTTKERSVNKVHTDNKQTLTLTVTLTLTLTLLSFPWRSFAVLVVPPSLQTVCDNYNLKSHKYVCITTYHSDTKSNSSSYPNSNHLIAPTRANDVKRNYSWTYTRLCEASWLAIIVSLAHTDVVGTGDLRMVRGGTVNWHRELIPERKEGWTLSSVNCERW